MFASTNVLTALPPFGATPSVSTLKFAEPFTESVEDACAVTLPGVGEAKVIVHCPFASVFAVVQVPVAVVCVAPFEFVSVKWTCSPCAATNVPVPGSFSSVTVKVCGWPISFVASGAIAILASTHVFVAGPEFAAVPSVFRVRETPPTKNVVCALIVVTPVVAEVRLIVQLPLAFVVHDVLETLPPDRLPGPAPIEKVTSTPDASAKAVPSLTLTCAVNV